MNLLLEGISCAGKQTRSRKSLIVEMEKKKHGDTHYTFTKLTELKRRKLVVPFYPMLLFILTMEFLLGVLTRFLIINDKITTKCTKIFIKSTSYVHKLCIFSKVRTVCGQIG